MNKKVIFNGIELSMPNYGESALTIFDYLENVASRLERELNDEDGNFQLSIDVDFSTTQPPRHKIEANGSTPKWTKDKVSKILERSATNDDGRIQGSVRVTFLVEDR